MGFKGPVVPSRWQQEEDLIKGVSSAEAACSEDVIQCGQGGPIIFCDVFMTLWRFFVSASV